MKILINKVTLWRSTRSSATAGKSASATY